MNKYKKKLLIILISECVFFTIFISMGIIDILITFSNRNFSINTYKHSKGIIYTDEDYCYYDNQMYKNEKNIVWIGDNYYIYFDNNFFYLNDGQETKKLLSNNMPIIYSTLFYKNNFIYFKNLSGYFEYNITDNIINQIEKDYYYKNRDGNLYSIDSTEIDSSILYLKKVDENLVKKVDFQTLKTNECFNKLSSKYRRIDGYSVVNQDIYIHCSFDKCSLTLKYDFQTEELQYYDWFNKETTSIYSSFICNLNDNHPIFQAFNK